MSAEAFQLIDKGKTGNSNIKRDFEKMCRQHGKETVKIRVFR